MNKSTKVKVVDTFNGWQSLPMTPASAAKLAAGFAANARKIVPATAEWRYDYRIGEWAWFDGEERVS